MTNPLQTLIEKAKAAQPGPLEIERSELECGYFTYKLYNGPDFAVISEIANFEYAKKNAEFIKASSPDKILALCESMQECLDALCKIADNQDHLADLWPRLVAKMAIEVVVKRLEAL